MPRGVPTPGENAKRIREERARFQAQMDQRQQRIQVIEAKGNKATPDEVRESIRLSQEWARLKGQRDAVQ